jgi:hypothetical protein
MTQAGIAPDHAERVMPWVAHFRLCTAEAIKGLRAIDAVDRCEGSAAAAIRFVGLLSINRNTVVFP